MSSVKLEPTGAPRNVKTESFLSTSKIFVQWDHVSDLEVGGIRKGYKVVYKKVSEVNVPVHDDVKTLMMPANTTHVQVSGLDTYSKYSFMIIVFNNLMGGEPSAPVYGG